MRTASYHPSPPSVQTRTNTPAADRTLIEDVAAEVARLKSPEPASPDRELHLTIIGKRIEQEGANGNAWIKANLTREHRRTLSIKVSYGPIHAHRFWDDEPPLNYDSWDHFIESNAESIVTRRRETGCPIFELWGQPAPHVWPPVTVRPTTDEDRAEALAAGTKALETIIAEEARNLRTLRALHRAAVAVETGEKTLEDPAVVKAWARGLEFLYGYGDSIDETGDLCYAADMNLGLVSGQRAFMKGGSQDDEFYPMPRKRIDEEIAKYGSA